MFFLLVVASLSLVAKASRKLGHDVRIREFRCMFVCMALGGGRVGIAIV